MDSALRTGFLALLAFDLEGGVLDYPTPLAGWRRWCAARYRWRNE